MLTILMPRQSNQQEQEQAPAAASVQMPAPISPQDGAAEVLRILTDVIPFRIDLIQHKQCVDTSCLAILSACKQAADWMNPGAALAPSSAQAPAHPAKSPSFCVNCTHIRHADKPAPFCAAVIAEVSPVHGPRHQYCVLARNDMGECGVEGRLFEARPTPAPYERRQSAAQPSPSPAPQPFEPGSAVRDVTFATDHLIAIELALEDRIELIKRQIGFNPADMYWRDALDVARQALELVQ